MYGYKFITGDFSSEKVIVVYTLRSNNTIDKKIYVSQYTFDKDESILKEEAILALETTYSGIDRMIPLPISSETPGNITTPSECINTTHDKAYDYKKSIQGDGTVKYYFIGNFGKYKERFPNWTEAVDDGKWGTIRRNAIIEKVKFDCEAGQPTSTPNPTPPSSSQTSNIINNSEDPKQDTLYGTVVDKKTLEPIKGANVQYGTLSTITDEIGMFSLDVPSQTKPSPPPPVECINTDHDRAYNYKRLTYSDGKVEYYFIGLFGQYLKRFPNWTEAVDDGSFGTTRRNAIIEKVKFDCPPVTFPQTSSLNTPPETPPTPTNIPINPTSQLRTITGEIQISDSDPGGVYNGAIQLVKDEFGNITEPPYQTRTDFDGKFTLSIPIDGKFIQAKKPGRSTQTIYLPITQETNYVFDFSSQANEGVIQEQVETTVVASAKKLEITAVDYEKYSIVPLKGDGSYRNNLGIIGLNSTKAQLDNDILNNLLVPELQITEATDSKKDAKWWQNQKLIDLLNKLKEVLIPIILGMIAKFGITKLNELYQDNKSDINDSLTEAFCPTPEELEKLIQRKNKLVKQLNNAQKTIEVALKIVGITRSFTQIFTAIARGIDVAQLALPTSLPGVTAGQIQKVDDVKKGILDKTEQFNIIINDIFLTLNILRSVLVQIISYLGLLDKLIEKCYEGSKLPEQEQLSAELTALTQEQAEQKSPVVTIVNGFTMGVETENTTNSLKRRRATATNAGGVVMLRGEWSFSSIDQILIDELVFYIQVNDLKAD